ncbi:TMEM131_like domain-containing protein [Psidium guajava]|nr:TMEM131_like domain-containing protein [Psidium guajava]
MDAETLPIRRAPSRRSMFCLRGSFHLTKASIVIGFLSCIFFSFVACGCCFEIGVQESVEETNGCGSSDGNYGAGIPNIILGDVDSHFAPDNSKARITLGDVCSNSEFFCFPSTLPGFLSEKSNTKDTALEASLIRPDDPLFVRVGPGEFTQWASNSSWSSDYGVSILANGRTVSCSLNSRKNVNEFSYSQPSGANQHDISSCRAPLLNQKSVGFSQGKNSEIYKSGSFGGFLSPNIEINPPILDWGEKYLYGPSIAFLTVSNNWSDSILHVYQPFSTDVQFFPCNFTEAVLEPGEVASLCFVFLPRWQGLSSAHLIVQTNFGGFLVQARGFAVKSPYGIQPILGVDESSGGRWRKNLSLFNPFDESLHVEEIALWLSVSLGNNSLHMEATCIQENPSSSDELQSVKDWFLVKSSPLDLPVMGMRSHKSWEVGPQISEDIVEIDLTLGSVGKVLGAFCMQLTRSSKDGADVVMVPIEAEIDDMAVGHDIAGLLSISLESVTSSDVAGSFVSISLRNSATHVITVTRISEIANSKLFQIKYMDGLVLFPGTITQVAVLTCNHISDEIYFTRETFDADRKCKLLIQTNDSQSQTEILCQDILHICLRRDSFSGYNHQVHIANFGNKRTLSLDHLRANAEALQTAELDEFVLGNWKSQGTNCEMSVLDDYEVFFNVVPVGTHLCKWITVHNPSQQPVIMQLLLNSGEMIDECKDPIQLGQPISSGILVHGESVKPLAYGFSVAESALTEAFVHPQGQASLGPLVFHPSHRCEWRSSLLVRNNLSGVEWLSLRGIGGSYSLVLVENSEPVQKLEFDLDFSDSLNIFNQEKMTSQLLETTDSCHEPLTKVIYAKNTGDLPLEVRRIRVSGTDCKLDGFMVHNCTNLSLEPGEAKKLVISYRSNFLAPVEHRDLELDLATGILVIPMKANIPLTMLGSCKKSLFLIRMKRIFEAIFLAAPFVVLVLFCIFPQMTVFCLWDWRCGRGKDSIMTKQSKGKSSGVHYSRKSSKRFGSTKLDRFPNFVVADKPLLPESMAYADNLRGCEGEHGIGALDTKSDAQDLETLVIPAEAHKEREQSCLPLSLVGATEGCNVLEEVSQPGNLSVRIGKDKRRRRRKRKGAGAGLSALFEVSSSQSGNSTPSSPLSPVSSVPTPRRICPLSPDPEQCIETRNPLSLWPDRFKERTQVSESVKKGDCLEPAVSDNKSFTAPQEQPPARAKTASKSVLLPSATFPSARRPTSSLRCSSSYLDSVATIAPHARAPGSQLCSEKTVKSEKKAEFRNEFTYDIWGDHFPALRMLDQLRDDPAKNSSAVNSDSKSFFVRGPQTLVKKYQPGSISSQQGG